MGLVFIPPTPSSRPKGVSLEKGGGTGRGKKEKHVRRRLEHLDTHLEELGDDAKNVEVDAVGEEEVPEDDNFVESMLVGLGGGGRGGLSERRDGGEGG